MKHNQLLKLFIFVGVSLFSYQLKIANAQSLPTIDANGSSHTKNEILCDVQAKHCVTLREGEGMLYSEDGGKNWSQPIYDDSLYNFGMLEFSCGEDVQYCTVVGYKGNMLLKASASYSNDYGHSWKLLGQDTVCGISPGGLDASSLYAKVNCDKSGMFAQIEGRCHTGTPDSVYPIKASFALPPA